MYRENIFLIEKEYYNKIADYLQEFRFSYLSNKEFTASMYDKEKEIINDIVNFQCHQCDFINDKLPEIYKNFVK